MSRVWEETVMIPTYPIGAAEKNPMFIEKRVYQGSSGRVYPYPTIETIGDEKSDQPYQAVFLENEYLKVMVLPELGGRIQRAYDKTNGYDFVYYNQVVKPALVGLTGPWISGGIEFNWPQHHRPSTFLPVDYELVQEEDGSAFVLLNDVDRIYGTKGICRIGLRPGRAYIEIDGQLYNRTDMPQTFLWWANPAVAVNDYTQTVFPPDVTAVMDHGKRDVSRFPIATGTYYKKDYSEGVDISRYKNIPVPTSFMAASSKYNFVGGYDNRAEAGILHVADHHVSPGKKQWTWGNGDFGRAWDRNLTDEDGPYVELMTGVFTDNQPDFTWLKPFEEKTFTQYFMPYKNIGVVKNATREAAVNLEAVSECGVRVRAYATSMHEKVLLTLTHCGTTVWSSEEKLSPVDIADAEIQLEKGFVMSDLCLTVIAEGTVLVSYRPDPEKIPEVPEPAKAAKEPEEIMTNEELYLTGLHLEQYRHATYLPDRYYLEGLKRDPSDIRINNAYGMLLYRRGLAEEAIPYFKKAIKRLIERNPNPYNAESYYDLGLAQLFTGAENEAYDSFYKATWTAEQQGNSFYYLAAIDVRQGRTAEALEKIERALVRNAHNIKARALKAVILRKLGLIETAQQVIADNLALDPFDYVSAMEALRIGSSLISEEEFGRRTRGTEENLLRAAKDYAEAGCYEEAVEAVERCSVHGPMADYYRGYYLAKAGKTEEALEAVRRAESDDPYCCFPNEIQDIPVLEYAMEVNPEGSKAPYYLGNLYYDKTLWQKAEALWEKSASLDGSFPTVLRNLSLVYYNKEKDSGRALDALTKAYALDTTDARIFFELDQLYAKTGMGFKERLAKYEAAPEVFTKRDDLCVEYATLLNACGRPENAYRFIVSRRFHPWEGGEGKIARQYEFALLKMAVRELDAGKPAEAEKLLRTALVYPECLGEGKLEGTKDNHLNYYLALALEKQGKAEDAEQYYRLASLGTDQPAGMMYYNDQPADMILYQGLALQKLGEKGKANARFYRLVDYGERHVKDQVKIEYFAVSLPDFLTFEDDLNIRNEAHCCFLMALGYMGLGNREKAEKFLGEARDKNPSDTRMLHYEQMMKR